MNRFPDHERRQLLVQRGIGPTVLARLEEAGIASIHALRRLGVPQVVHQVCGDQGNPAWGNRQRALVRAVEALDFPSPSL